MFWCFLMFWSCHFPSRFEGQPQRHQGRCICEKSRWRTGHFNRRDQFINNWSRIHQLLINISNGRRFLLPYRCCCFAHLAVMAFWKVETSQFFAPFSKLCLGKENGGWPSWLRGPMGSPQPAIEWAVEPIGFTVGSLESTPWFMDLWIYDDLWIQIFELRQTFPILSMSFQFQIHQSLKFSGLSHNRARKSFATHTLRTQHSSHLQIYMLAPCPLKTDDHTALGQSKMTLSHHVKTSSLHDAKGAKHWTLQHYRFSQVGSLTSLW